MRLRTHYHPLHNHLHPWLRAHPRMRRYITAKLIALVTIATLLYAAKLFLKFELPETYLSMAEHASLFCDVMFVGSNSE